MRLYCLHLTSEGLRFWIYRGAVLIGDAPAVTWSWPALVVAPGDLPRLFLVERTPQTSRLGHLFLLRLGLIGPVSAGSFVPLEVEACPAVGAGASGTEIYFGSASRVWRSPVYAGGPDQRVDVSADVAAYRAHWGRRGAGSLLLVLEGESVPAVIRPGWQVCLRDGYVTGAGAEWVCRAPYWIEWRGDAVLGGRRWCYAATASRASAEPSGPGLREWRDSPSMCWRNPGAVWVCLQRRSLHLHSSTDYLVLI